ncbi:VTC domain-containing protein [Maribacter halichondriae]|uniref:VTC domain-containing protein n=1 Tax=Maribacter halichondriae TaxID=2980554 RepID=UPI002359D6D0|nr:VTC domain-containing protein [Maribacter sp. Hal144]
MQKEIVRSLHNFSPISLEDMDNVSLLKRTDTKFMLHRNQLLQIFEAIQDSYNVLEIEGSRISSYQSLYYDTKENLFYKSHHNGKIRRAKIRKRRYKESGLTFLEVKKKDGKGNTNKFRSQIPDFDAELCVDSQQFLSETIPMEQCISPTLKNTFKRITLVSKSAKERVTIDFNLKFKNEKRKKSFKRLVIIEVKQERLDRSSPIIVLLKSIGNTPERISKYCLGMVSLYKDLKYNIFKKKILRINKLTSA